MHLALWIVAGLLALAFVAGGTVKLAMSKERIYATGHSGHWVEDWSAGGVKAIGALEVLGGLGLVLPALVGIATGLVPVAGVGLGVIMVGAAVTRFRRGEVKLVAVDFVYLALLAFVVWGRFVVEPFTG
ncbi:MULTISPECIES: DoxX family protein [unclassified Saccharothrix]|uniref:DoxX family protein n=1 Tax=unclassified Saccharothrix TaxID=2593673 RepID=UPI00307EB795